MNHHNCCGSGKTITLGDACAPGFVSVGVPPDVCESSPLKITSINMRSKADRGYMCVCVCVAEAVYSLSESAHYFWGIASLKKISTEMRTVRT